MVWAIDVISRAALNKGLAVVILVVLMRLVLFPISRYTTVSMLKMQDLQPELSKIKAEFKDDTQRQQLEQMKVMRERGVNPLMGCLPMALQMPFWIALYTGIQVSISLRQAPLLPFWIVDLSRPDALLTFKPVDNAIIGFIGGWANWQLNVLPVLMLGAFYLQTQFQPQPAGTSPEMERQQKLMKYLMPGLMFFLFYSMPSALNLYIMASSVMGYAETRFVRWHYAQMKLRPSKPRKQKPKNFFSRWMEAKFEELHKLQERVHKSEPSLDRSKKRDKKK
jgi:YidC/Oxa1 family membrane protein insertase